MRNTALTTSPIPLIDSLEHLGNPLTTSRRVLANNPDLPDSCFDDLVHTLSFLVSYNGSKATFNSYRRELFNLTTIAIKGRLTAVITDQKA